MEVEIFFFKVSFLSSSFFVFFFLKRKLT